MEPVEEERNEISRKRPFIKTAHEYADVATIHGIYYIFEFCDNNKSYAKCSSNGLIVF